MRGLDFTGRWYGVLRLQGVIRGCDGIMPTFVRSGGKPIAYANEADAMRLAETDRARFKVCRISPEVERRYGVQVVR